MKKRSFKTMFQPPHKQNENLVSVEVAFVPSTSKVHQCDLDSPNYSKSHSMQLHSRL